MTSILPHKEKFRTCLLKTIMVGIAVVASLSIATAQAFALEYSFGNVDMSGIESSKDSSISLELVDPASKQALSGVRLYAYKVADISNKGFSYTQEFEALRSSVTWPSRNDGESIPASEWEALAQSLSAGVAAQGLSPLASASSNAQGFVELSKLKPGLYLVNFDSFVAFDKRFSFAPLLITLPSLSNPAAGVQQEYNYQVKAEPKVTSKPLEKTPQQWKLIKHWMLEGDTSRLDVSSIKVQIVRDLKPYGEPVELNEANNWTYSFTDEDGSHDWSAYELLLEGNIPHWTQKISISTGEILLTNTIVQDNPGTEPNPGTDPDINTPKNPSKPGQDTPSKPQAPKPEKLPQTGQLWWPVPALLCVACVCFGVSRLAAGKQR